MKRECWIRYTTLGLVILLATILTACSYDTDFVIINDSTSPIQVQYHLAERIKEPLKSTGLPAKLASAQLRTGGNNQWQELSSDQYQLVQDRNIVRVQVLPNEALRINSLPNYGNDETAYSEFYYVDEIIITGAKGEILLRGDQARTAFVAESRALYTFKYK